MSVYNAGDLGSIPGEGNGNPLQYSCLENPMDGEVWQATVHGVSKSRTRLSNFTFTLLPFAFFQGGLECWSSWDHKESDMTEQLH